ncbi:hypothetical protein LA080_001403 [Diaporthe eres]|nr:hypothetical protein LA080_001403 [Diaporthe eres]
MRSGLPPRPRPFGWPHDRNVLISNEISLNRFRILTYVLTRRYSDITAFRPTAEVARSKSKPSGLDTFWRPEIRDSRRVDEICATAGV